MKLYSLRKDLLFGFCFSLSDLFGILILLSQFSFSYLFSVRLATDFGGFLPTHSLVPFQPGLGRDKVGIRA